MLGPAILIATLGRHRSRIGCGALLCVLVSTEARIALVVVIGTTVMMMMMMTVVTTMAPGMMATTATNTICVYVIHVGLLAVETIGIAVVSIEFGVDVIVEVSVVRVGAEGLT